MLKIFKLTVHSAFKTLVLFSLFLILTNSCKKEITKQEHTRALFRGKKIIIKRILTTTNLLIPCKYYVMKIEGTLEGSSSNPNFNVVKDYIEIWGTEVCNKAHDSRELALSALHSYELSAASYAQGYGLTWRGSGPLLDPIIEDCNGTYVPPNTGGGSDPGTVTLPPLSEPTDTLNKIMLNNNMSATQLQNLRTLLSRFLSGDGNTEWACIHKQLYRYMVTGNLKFNFSMNSSIQSEQAYNSVSQTFSFNNDNSFIDPTMFEHEFFHAYQDMFIGTDTYAVGAVAGGYPAGYVNIEFETALFGDIIRPRAESNAFINYSVPQDVRNEYYAWLDSITANNTKYPKIFDDFAGKYNYFLKKFKLYSGYADKGEILLDLKPMSLLNLFSTTPCK